MMLASTMVPSLSRSPLGLQMGVDLLQQSLAQLVPLQEMAEVQDGGLVRQGFRQVQAHETPDRFGLPSAPLRTDSGQGRGAVDAGGHGEFSGHRYVIPISCANPHQLY